MAVLKDLIVHGPSRFLNGSRFNTINAESIGAEQGIFNKLIATTLDAKEATIDNLTAQNATVVGLLDVQGELHTNAWTNANIANIGGSFYISPTVEPTDGTTTISITRVSATSWTVSATGTFATDFIKSGTATSGVAWPANSLVLITGDVVIGDMIYPLGTLKGTLNAAVTATAASTSKTITITGVTDAQNNNAPSVLQELYELNNNANISNAAFKKGKISLYKLGSNPIGILMTSMGTNSNSLMDIYGGVSTTPSVRIGHLGALASYTDTAGNTRQPTGWGIYTDNGFFKGVIVADSGSIGHFTINSKAIYSGSHDTWNKSSTGIFLGTNDTNYYISGGSGASWWIRDDGRFQFGGTNGITYNGTTLSVPAANVSGELTAATINGSKITANSITAGQIASNAITTDELAADAVTSAKIKAGEVKATNIASNAVTADKLDATTINASKKLTVGAMTDTDQNNILNSNIQIGGENLFRYSHPNNTYWWNSNTSGATVSGDKITITQAGEFFQRYRSLVFPSGQTIPAGTELTLSCYFYENTLTGGNHQIYYSWQQIENGSAYSQWLSHQVPLNYTGLWSVTFTTTKEISGLCIEYDTRNMTSGKWVCGPCKLEKGNKATAWSPAPEDIDVHKYVTDIDSNNGITIKPINTTGNDYLQINSTSIDFFRGAGSNSAAVSVMSLSDSVFRMGKSNVQRVEITASAVDMYDKNNKLTTRVNENGLTIYKAGTQVASYGTDATIGQVAANLYNVFIDADGGIALRKNTTSLLTINSSQIDINNSSGNAMTRVDSSGLTVYDGSGTADANKVAIFGSTVQVGKKAAGYTTIASTGMDIYAGSSNTLLAHIGYTNDGVPEGGGSQHVSAAYYSFGSRASGSDIGAGSFSTGGNNTASGYFSHAEGKGAQATGDCAHAEGYYPVAAGHYSHASGKETVADQDAQTAVGKYNTKNNTNNLFVVGVGTSDSARKNGFGVASTGKVTIDDKPLIKVVTNISLNSTQLLADGYTANNLSKDVSSSIPSGYTMVAVIPRTTGGNSVVMYYCEASGTTVYYRLRNYGAAVTVTPAVQLICVKSEIL